MDIPDDTMLKMMSPDLKMMMPPDPKMMMMPPDPKMMMPPDPKMMMPPDPKMMMLPDPKMLLPPHDPKMMMPPDPKMMLPDMRMMMPEPRMMMPEPRMMPPDLKMPPPGIGMMPPDMQMAPNPQMMPPDMQIPPDLRMVPPGVKMMPPVPKSMRNSLGKASPKEPLPCDECHKTFKFKSLLVAHKKSAHTAPKPFKCKLCPKTFKKETYLQIHERIHDDKTSVMCNICFQKFPYISKLRIHQQSHLKNRANTNFPTNFMPPPGNASQDLNVPGYNPSETPALPDNLEPKVKIEATEGIPSATTPPEKFAPQAVDTYMSEVNMPFLKMPDACVSQDIKTEQVADKTNNLDSLPMQPSNPTGTKSKGKVPKPFKCSLCPKAFKKDAYLQIHVRIHDERTVCICNICFKPFPQKGKLRAHQRLTHFRDKPYVRVPKKPLMDPKIDIGSEKSSSGQINISNPDLPENRTNDSGEQLATPPPPPSANLPVKRRKKKICSINPQSMCSVQVTTEDGVETKICDICHKPYIESSNGFQQCSGVECYLCDRTFSSMGDLDKHIMEHKTQKNYPCHLCEKRFLQNSELKEHFSKHTADGYYFCHFCNQSFSQQKSLDAHVVQHILEQNFFCQFCNKCFLQQSDLDAHLTDHIVNENYPCETCGLLLLSSADLEEHLAVHDGKNEDSHQNPSS